MPLFAQVISINFAGDADPANQVDGSETAGIPAVGSFNNLTGITGSDIPLVDDSGTESGATVTFRGHWNAISSNVELGYDGDNGLFQNSLHQDKSGDLAKVEITLTNIPYSLYDVYVYFSSPFGARIYSATINGADETFGKALGGSQPLDELSQFVQAFAITAHEAERSNYIVWQNVSGTSLNIVSNRFVGPPTPDGSVGIAGLQIVADPNSTNTRPAAPKSTEPL